MDCTRRHPLPPSVHRRLPGSLWFKGAIALMTSLGWGRGYCLVSGCSLEGRYPEPAAALHGNPPRRPSVVLHKVGVGEEQA